MTAFEELVAPAEALLSRYRSAGVRLATVESCTGGLIAAALTAVPGSSDVVECGFVTYSNAAKTELVGVPAALIERHGAVSEEVARAMAEGGLAASHADIAIAVTGVAGPGGGSAEKPVGLVHVAVAARGGATRHRERRFGEIGRSEIRMLSVLEAFAMLGGALGAR